MSAVMRGRNTGRIFPWLLVAAVAVVFGQAVFFDFVNYDDYDLIVANTEFLGDPGSALTAFTTHAFSSHREEGVYYRPLLLLTYILDYHLWGLNPGGFHFTNILLHAIATVFLFLLLGKVAEDRIVPGGAPSSGGGVSAAAFLGSLLFAVHPVQTEAVAWIAGRNDVLLGLFLILFLYFYASSDAGRFRFPLAALFYAAALLTKEPAVFYVLLAPLYELTVGGKKPAALFSGAAYRRMLVLAAVTCAYLAVRYAVFGAFVGTEDLYGRIPPENRLLMAPGLFTENLLFLLAPFSLNIAHPIENVVWFEGTRLVVAVAVMAGAVISAVSLSRRAPVVSWAVLWVLVGMVPLLNIFPLAVPLLEHRLYAVVAGAGAVLAFGIVRWQGPGRMRAGIPAVAAVVCLACAGLSIARMPVWRDSGTLWTDAIAKEPGSARAYFNLAGYYYERRQFDSTAALLEKYVGLRPEDTRGYSKLRETYWLAGNTRGAAAVCRRLIALNPRNVSRYIEAGILFERIGMSDSVIAVYEEGIRTDSSFYQLNQRLGAWYLGLGDTAAAMRQFENAIRVLEGAAGRAALNAGQRDVLAGLYLAVNRRDLADSLARAGGAVR